MNNTPLIFWIVPLASLVALGFAWYFFRARMRCSEGTDRMKEIAAHVRPRRDGLLATTIQSRNGRLSDFGAVLRLPRLRTGRAEPVGSVRSSRAAFSPAWPVISGMRTATYASARTAHAASQSLNQGLRVAFRSGAVMGLVIVGLVCSTSRPGTWF